MQSLRTYCLRKSPLVTEDFPFDEQTLVIKILGKAFLLGDITVFPPAVNLKCEPRLAIELRARYEAVTPGFHMNKKHWNTVTVDGTIPDEDVRQMIDRSFDLVVSGLKGSQRDRVGGNKGDQKRKSRTKVRPRAHHAR